MRVLFKNKDKYKRLFFITYQKDEFYIGSSLKRIFSAGINDIGDVVQIENKYQFEINEDHDKQEFKSLNFSFHKSGVRQLRCEDNSKNKIELYREKYNSLESAQEPELLFTLISKRISYYDEYINKLTKKDTNAITLDTPEEYINCRNTFEFFISPSPNQNLPSFIIPHEHRSSQMNPIKLKDELYLHIRFIVIAPDSNPLNLVYPDREIIIFKDYQNDKLKFFSFK